MSTSTTAVPAPADDEASQSTRRERVGWYFYDWANSAFPTTVITVFLGPYLTAIAERGAGCAEGADSCTTPLFHLFGTPVLPGSIFPYAVSLSVLLQVFILPVAGAIADRSSHKKQLLALFAYIGSGATIGLLFLAGDRWILGAALFLVGNLSFGASVVVYNSFLPQIAGPDQRDSVSSIGWAVGYIGGGLLLLINLVAVIFKDSIGMSTGEVARWSLVSAGVWWAGFTTIPLLRLRNRPAVAGEHRGPVLTDGFRQLFRTLGSLKAFPLTLFFLIAYLVYNDGIQTVITQAGVYATEQLKLPDTVLVPTILMVQFLAFGGALLLGAMAKRFGAWKTVLGSLVFWTIILVLAFYLPVGESVPFIALGGLIGVVLGGSQALSRSLFSQLIPKGKEGEYFGLYEISDKGTSWLGPLLFGLAYSLTGSYRVAIISLISFFVIGFVGLLAIPMRRAIVAAGNEPPHAL